MKPFRYAVVLYALLASGCVVLGPPLVSGTLLLQARIAASQPEGTVVVTGGPVIYRALRFEVEGTPVVIYRLLIVYRDGERDDLHVNWVVNRGRWTRGLDLAHRERPIESVILYYRPVAERGGGEKEQRGESGQVATVRVFGLQ